MKISLDKLKNIMKDVESDDAWVNDSHSESEYNGGIRAMKIIIEQILKEGK
tara:strand:+ start:5404 stop:5556 length:153 start_codon:yes stop_codon:yes gene_type:complete